MHPGAGAGAVAGGAGMDVRAAARANIVLGLAMAAIALVAASINPGDFRAQITEQCAATAAQALDLREEALQLVLMGVVQAVFAAAADVAVSGSLPGLGRWLGVPAHLIGAANAYTLFYVVNGAALVCIGHCAGKYLVYLVIGYVLFAVSYVLLLGVSLAVTFF